MSTSSVRRPFAALSVTAAAALLLAGCGGTAESAEEPTGSAGSTATTSAPSSVEIEDNNGTQTVALPPQSVVATDNRTFETLAAWGVELSAAALALAPDTVEFANQDDIIDLGSHREPNLEAVVAVEPDLIINGQRFAEFHEDFASLAPGAAVLSLDPRDGEPFDAELKRQVMALGEIFGKQAEAEALAADLDAAIERVTAAYDPEDTVMGVITSGGEIGYVAPGAGRTIGPMFDIVGLTPALEVPEGSEDHQGDDISVEAIAQSDPDWIIVMDRDAAVTADDPAYTPGSEIIEGSEALADVTAVREGNVIYMPADTYTNEGIQTYTEFFTAFADALEASS
ncbi:siderophore ABC transporter substrate-binding protein [Georgenia faecalis]|uniref:Siderophore ABC transporter substrate-binding protein n=1 Tax=Georgenia faecalis TaxID=2483799 RepID=A0ABV9DFA2_9MICO|nr:ABC transporter substrate-binding protein [Georgenia faecalis]